MHGLGAEALPKLANELLAQQLNLLPTLGFDAFELGVGMGPQLLGDFSASRTCLVDHLRRLGLGLLERLGVLACRRRRPSSPLGMVARAACERSPAGSSSCVRTGGTTYRQIRNTMTAKPMSCPMKVDIRATAPVPLQQAPCGWSPRRRARGSQAATPASPTDV